MFCMLWREKGCIRLIIIRKKVHLRRHMEIFFCCFFKPKKKKREKERHKKGGKGEEDNNKEKEKVKWNKYHEGEIPLKMEGKYVNLQTSLLKAI